MNENIWALKPGDSVHGSYLGVDYRGTVSDVRTHSMNHAISLVSVDLATAVTVFGMERDSLIISASDDSAALSLYLGHTDTATIEVDR